MRTKVWVAFFVEIAVLAALLFGSAGTFRWRAAWEFLGLLVLLSAPMIEPLIRHDPAVLEERMKSPVRKDQAPWDRVLMTILLALFVAWWPLMGLDAGRHGWSAMPDWLRWIGGAGMAITIWASYRILWANTYLSSVVRVQGERGHKVVSTGPYAIVRHPLYVVSIVLFASMAIMLGSWWGLAFSALLDIVLVARTAMEDRKLHEELEGYRDYAARVRYRLVPGIW